MKLVDLNPRWVSAGGEGISRMVDGERVPVPERLGIGIGFDCPCGCEDRAFVYFSNPLDGGPAYENAKHCWKRGGEDFASLTLTPSIQRVGGCEWHGHITNGQMVQA